MTPMMKRFTAGGVLLVTCTAAAVFLRAQEAAVPDAATLQTMAARFAPTEISADISKLPANDRRALAKLVEASKIVDALFLRQVWAGNDAMLQELAQLAARPVGPRASRTAAARLHYFLINKGPWDRLDHNKAFVPGAPAKPDPANFYPAGATKAEVQKWTDGLSGAAKDAATGFFTTIRRGEKGFVPVPTASSTRENWRARPSCCARRRSSPPTPR